MDLSALRTASRQRADEESTGFIDNDELDGYINQGYKIIYAKMVGKYTSYFIIPGTTGNGGEFDTVADQQLYDLPSDFFKLVRVEMRDSSSDDDRDFYRLKALNISNYDFSARYPYRAEYFYRYGYYLAGNKIGLRPIPSDASNTIRLWYVPTVTELSADGDVPVIQDVYHDSIADFAAIKCLSKSGEGIYKEKYQEWEDSLETILQSMEPRNQNAEQMVFSEDYENDLWENRFPWST